MTDLVSRLRALGLPALANGWEDVVALVTTKRWSFTQAIEHIAALEEKERARRGLERRTGAPDDSRDRPLPGAHARDGIDADHPLSNGRARRQLRGTCPQ